MKILGIKVENVMGLEFIDLSPSQNFNKIVGKNAQGKTSFAQALRWGLGGPSALADKSVVIRKGADEAVVHIDLGDYELTRRQPVGGQQTVRVVSKSDRKKSISSPQKFLSELIGGPVTQFDPGALAKMSPSALADLLRQAQGVDTSDLDAEEEKVYAERTSVNREIKRLEGVISEYVVEEIPAEVEPDTDISVLVNELQSASKTNLNNNRFRNEATKIQEDLATAEERLVALEAAVEAQKFLIKGLKERQAKAAEFLANVKDVDVEALNAKIKVAQEENRARQKRRESRAELVRRQNSRDEFEAALKQQQRISDHHSSRLKEIEKERLEKLKATKLPVTGLEVRGSRVTYNGVPLHQASTSELVRIGAAVTAALHPGLDAVVIDGAESLDSSTLEVVREWSESVGIQVFALIAIESESDPRAEGAAAVIEGGRKKSGK